MDYGYEQLLEAMREAKLEKDPSKLDLALRALAHYNARGTAIDTTETQFAPVLALDPNFYG